MKTTLTFVMGEWKRKVLKMRKIEDNKKTHKCCRGLGLQVANPLPKANSCTLGKKVSKTPIEWDKVAH